MTANVSYLMKWLDQRFIEVIAVLRHSPFDSMRQILGERINERTALMILIFGRTHINHLNLWVPLNFHSWADLVLEGVVLSDRNLVGIIMILMWVLFLIFA